MSTECSMIAEELLQLCKEESHKNLEIKERIQANNKAIQQLQAQLNEEVKRDIEALTSQYQEKNDNSGNAVEEMRKEEQQLLQDLKEVEKHNEELSAQCQESEQKVEKLKEMKNNLQGDKERLDNETTVILPKRRYCNRRTIKTDKLKEMKNNLQGDKERLDNETTVILPKRREEISLYQNISRIRFDFEGSKNDVKGYMVNNNDVKPFLFDKSKNSDFFITNALWDSMKEDD